MLLIWCVICIFPFYPRTENCWRIATLLNQVFHPVDLYRQTKNVVNSRSASEQLLFTASASRIFLAGCRRPIFAKSEMTVTGITMNC